MCGQKFDSSHVAVKAWGSEDITALVGEHSHADKAIEELYPSVLEELKQKVNNPNLTDEQLDKIATKIAEKGFYTKSEINSMIAGIVVPTRLSELADDTEHRTVTDTEKEKWNKPTITIDTELNENSNNPIANKVVTTRLKGMYEGMAYKADRAELENYATKTELETKANKADIPTKLAQLAEDETHRLVTDEEKAKWNALKNVNVVTEVTEENMNSEDPIATKVVTQALLENYNYYESKQVEVHANFELIGLDQNRLHVITSCGMTN